MHDVCKHCLFVNFTYEMTYTHNCVCIYLYNWYACTHVSGLGYWMDKIVNGITLVDNVNSLCSDGGNATFMHANCCKTQQKKKKAVIIISHQYTFLVYTFDPMKSYCEICRSAPKCGAIYVILIHIRWTKYVCFLQAERISIIHHLINMKRVRSTQMWHKL